ncbi:MAG: hypothetical protein DRQ39_05810 [Gammaproteobacteria bacterium]|nr:MAG: hypothetical protein DRQ39_05810 [Gammaproteobacteria bacterium]RKZ93920.1 MAG: hypothetical protein DRQ46_10805 [Gammaproteobacteria bacterium]RKZ94610.1 MAG: hypothetical protein DRQ40_05480 [Gammaproteobacteria bacterium]
MTAYLDVSTILSPLLTQFQPESVLIVGETARDFYQDKNDTRSQVLTTPFNLDKLSTIVTVDLAIISEITDTLVKPQALEWLGMIRNCYAQHIIVISDIEQSTQQGWQLADFLGMGMKHVATTAKYQIFSYAIENYQLKREWQNSQFWANPENYDKYRW